MQHYTTDESAALVCPKLHTTKHSAWYLAQIEIRKKKKSKERKSQTYQVQIKSNTRNFSRFISFTHKKTINLIENPTLEFSHTCKPILKRMMQVITSSVTSLKL